MICHSIQYRSRTHGEPDSFALQLDIGFCLVCLLKAKNTTRAIVGKELHSEKLARIHFWLFVPLIIITSTLGVVAGYQGGILFSAKRFTEIDATIGPYMMMLTPLYIIEAFVPIGIFAYNIHKTITKK